MEIDHNARIGIQKVRQYMIVQLRRDNLQEAGCAQLSAHLEHPAVLKSK